MFFLVSSNWFHMIQKVCQVARDAEGPGVTSPPLPLPFPIQQKRNYFVLANKFDFQQSCKSTSSQLYFKLLLVFRNTSFWLFAKIEDWVKYPIIHKHANHIICKDIFFCYIKRAAKLYFTHYSYVVIILFSTGLQKSALSTNSFGKLFLRVLCFLPVLHCI